MANKYIRQGETYNGDGTTSAAATSNGGVGAWNTLAVFEGTTPAYGTLAAGDVVYIRSLDNADAAITRTLAATTTLGAGAGVGTANSRVDWVIDAGTVWAGINGVITYNFGSNYNVDTRAYNYIRAEAVGGLAIVQTTTNPNTTGVLVRVGVELENLDIDLSASASGNGCCLQPYGLAQAVVVLRRCRLKFNVVPAACILIDGSCQIQFIDCEYELLTGDTDPLFSALGNNPKIEVIGGRVYGAGATGGTRALLRTASGGFTAANIVGLDFPRQMPLTSTPTTYVASVQMDIVGADNGLGAAVIRGWGQADSRDDNYYPKLNAQLPNSTGSGWSWKIYPSFARDMEPARLVFGKLFSQAAATKTITLETLIADDFTTLNKSTMWIEGSYIDDTTGLPAPFTSRDFAAGALTTSTAPWSATSYGPANLLKRSLSFTTPTTIKQDTLIVVTLRISVPAGSVDQIVFACPDFAVP